MLDIIIIKMKYKKDRKKAVVNFIVSEFGGLTSAHEYCTFSTIHTTEM